MTKRRRVVKSSSFGVLYELRTGMPRRDVTITKLYGSTEDPNVFVEIPVTITKFNILGIDEKSKRKQIVYEFKFDVFYNFIYTGNTCGINAEGDKLSNDFNKTLSRKKIILYDFGNIEDVVFYVENTNKFYIAGHEGGNCYLYISTESSDIPGKNIKNDPSDTNEYYYKFLDKISSDDD
jgi:hypothetical protein